MSLLNQIGLKHGTDKASDIHNYLVNYQKYLPFERASELKILEIGVLNGSSTRTWKEYFFRSQIIGIDINPECKRYEEDKITIEIGSQIDGEFLNSVVEKHGPFDMILDDGSHLNSHVIYSFEQLWKSVKSKGVYVVEDSVTSYWEDYEGGYLKPTSSVEYFKRLLDDVNFRGVLNFNKPNVHARREDWCIENAESGCLIDIESITFLNGIIIITKR